NRTAPRSVKPADVGLILEEFVTITGTAVTEAVDSIENKVAAVEGKGLSTNDYTDEDKAIVDSITSGDLAETTLSIKTKLGAATFENDGYLDADDFAIFTNKAD